MVDKILFLDIDGVMNNEKVFRTYKGMGVVKTFDPVAVELLDRIVTETGCGIVLSSTWRLGGIESIFEPIDNACIGHKDRAERIKSVVFDRTPDSFSLRDDGTSLDNAIRVYSRRGHEIQKWIDDNDFVGKFVIVDDDSDMVHLMDHLVQTTFEHGLTKDLAEEIIARLNG